MQREVDSAALAGFWGYNQDWGLMKGLGRRAALALAAFAALLIVAAAPAFAQVEGLYTGVNPPVVGGVLAASGERATVAPTAGVQGQVLSLQVRGGGVAATQQARVEGLAFTGADIATMVLIGMSALAVGVVLTRRSRPRSTSTG